MTTIFLHTALLGVLLAGVAYSQAGVQELSLSELELKNLNNFAEMVRGDLRREKRAVIGDSIGLDPANKEKFWPVYDRYEKEFKSLWDIRLANAKKYAELGEQVSDAGADALAQEFLKNETRMTALRSKYFGEFKAAVGPKLAARFLHVESVLDRIIELKVLAVVPLVP